MSFPSKAVLPRVATSWQCVGIQRTPTTRNQVFGSPKTALVRRLLGMYLVFLVPLTARVALTWGATAWSLWVCNLSTLTNHSTLQVASAYQTRQACVEALQWRWVGLKMIQTNPDDRSTTMKVREIIPDGPLDNVAEMIEASPTITAKIESGDDGGYHTLTCFPYTVDPRGTVYRSS